MNWRTYKQHKKKLGEVNVFWTRSNALFSRLIRFFTQSTVSHTGFLIKENGRVMCYEYVEGSGCVQMPASNRFKSNELILVKTVNVNKQKLLTKLYKDVGRVKYNMFGALISLVRRTHNQERFCSEGVAEKLGLKLSHLKRGITPADVLTALSDEDARR